MLNKLCALIEHHSNRVNLIIEYSKVCDWMIRITSRLDGSTVVCLQGCDLDYMSAKAYTKMCDWMNEEFGGY